MANNQDRTVEEEILDSELNERIKNKGSDIIKLVGFFNQDLQKIKFNYHIYVRHLKNLLLNFIEDNIKKVDSEECVFKDANGNAFELEFEDFSYYEDLEDDVFQEFLKIKKDLILFKNNYHIFRDKKDILLKTKTFEEFSDKIHFFNKRHLGEKRMKGILSSKYNFLKGNSEETEKLISLFCLINDAKISEKELVEYVGDKLKSMKDFNMFYSRVRGLLGYHDLTIEEILKKIEYKGLNAEVIKSDEVDKKLIVRILDYNASKKLSSKSWCIQYSEELFNNYVLYEKKYDIAELNNVQLILWDFNLEQSDPNFMIGITIDREGVTQANYKNNRNYVAEQVMKDYPELIHNRYWDVNDEDLVKSIESAELKRLVKLKLITEYVKDDKYIYQTYDYLNNKIDLSKDAYIWVKEYESIWAKRMVNKSVESKREYLSKMEYYFSKNKYYYVFDELIKEVSQNILSQNINKF